MKRAYLLGFAVAVAVATAAPATAQLPTLRGVVARNDGHAPVTGALVRLQHSGNRTTTGFNGGFVLTLASVPDTLIVTAIGFRPDTLPVGNADSVTVMLRDAPLALADLVAAQGTAELLASGDPESWKVSGKALRALPTAVEPDINRSLALVPGVSFSSPLSARPMLRGLDADDALMTLDGFTGINLYHIGRFFSAIPGLAVDHADVRFQPTGADLGGTTAGEVSIVGRSGTNPGSGDAQYGAGALSAAGGAASANGAASVFVAARTVKTSLLSEVLDNEHVDYDFHDLYANVRASPAGVPTMISFFATSDHVSPDTTQANPGDARMDWSNVLIGARSNLLRSADAGLTLSLAYSHHQEQSVGIPARDVYVDVRNDLSTFTAQINGNARIGEAMAFRYGAVMLHRDIQNVISPNGYRLNPYDPFGADNYLTNRNEQRAELGGYSEVAVRHGSATVTAGVRVDHADGLSVVQPRASVRIVGAHDSWIEFSAGRSARLFHLVSDSRSEPKYAYYDFWLPAGVDGIPAATMNNLSLGGAYTVGRWRLRADIFAASGDGEIDLKPHISFLVNTPGGLFRYGRSRVRGADISAVSGAADGSWSVGLSYVYAISERDWGDGWVPWIADRRHDLRFFGTVRATGSIRLSSTVAIASALPYTPVYGWVVPPDPGVGVNALYGPEMSARGLASLRLDASITKEFRGPWRSRWEAGFGVSNISAGDQAPRTGELLFTKSRPSTPYISEDQRFSLPVVPSIVVRGQFGVLH